MYGVSVVILMSDLLSVTVIAESHSSDKSDRVITALYCILQLHFKKLLKPESVACFSSSRNSPFLLLIFVTFPDK